MSFLYRTPAPVADVGIILVQAFIGFSWAVVIYRLVSFASQLDLIPIPSTFSHHSSLSSSPATPRSWYSLLGANLLFLISLIEVAFSIYSIYLIQCVQAPSDREQPSLESFREIMLRTLGSDLGPVPTNPQSSDALSAITPPPTYHPTEPLPYNHPAARDFRETHRLWFRNCKWEDIYRDNHIEWLCAVLFSKTLEEMRDEDRCKPKEESIEATLENLFAFYEYKGGCAIKSGYNKALRDKVIRLTKDPVKINLRPFTLTYGPAGLAGAAIHLMMYFQGFETKQCQNTKDGLKYLVRFPKVWHELPLEERPTPVVFIHGIGLGFTLYITLLHYLTYSRWSKERPVVVLISNPFKPLIILDDETTSFLSFNKSMEIFSPVFLKPPTQSQMTRDIAEMIETSGFRQSGFDILAHSNGTLVSAWIIKAFPDLVRRSCFIDPVCFGQSDSQVDFHPFLRLSSLKAGVFDNFLLCIIIAPHGLLHIQKRCGEFIEFRGCLHGGIKYPSPDLTASNIYDPLLFPTSNSFLYSTPNTGMEKIMRFGLGTELGMASYTQRHLDWTNVVLWPYQVPGFQDPERFVVILAGKDSIINSRRVRRYLIRHGMKDAFPVQGNTDTCQPNLPASSQDSKVQLTEINGLSTPEGLQSSYKSSDFAATPADLEPPKRTHGYQKGSGGIIYDPEASHGETFLPHNPHFKTIKNWLEGNGIEVAIPAN